MPQPHICYHAKFGRSNSNGIGVSRGSQKLGVLHMVPPLVIGTWFTFRNAPLSTCHTMPNLVVLGEMVRAYLQRYARKKICLSRPLNIIGTDTDRSTVYDFLLVIHNNHEPISYRFLNKGRFQSKCTISPLHSLGIM